MPKIFNRLFGIFRSNNSATISDQAEIIASKSMPTAEIKIRKDGIMHLHIKNELNVEFEDVQNVYKETQRLLEGKRYATLFTMTRLVTPDEQSRKFMASKERHERVIADAFVIKSLPQRLIGNFYLRINKPPSPTKLFVSEENALEWLKAQVEKDQATNKAVVTASD